LDNSEEKYTIAPVFFNDITRYHEPMSAEHHFELEMQVRDYECDMQGIVNNAVYQNYLEHTRHEYLRALGLDFAELHRQGTDPVVTRIEIDYKVPLTSGDCFLVTLSVQTRGRLRFVFEQGILRLPDRVSVVDARVTAVFVKDSRPIPPPHEVLEAIRKVSQ
jgi:acyl-CoA thioester hydrolase